MKKPYYRVSFHRPENKKPVRRPTYARFAKYLGKCVTPAVIKYPLTTDCALKKIENANTIVFIVDPSSTKKQIKTHFHSLYGVLASKVNTLVRPSADKKAFIKLHYDSEALDKAKKIGIM
eukprot:gnl/MRDRNA2_/MRDRNA2_78414_c0_seq1.p1 gnl/MRDRNA2_/MRDRNA2_78414_c0~~gnl/MRDRNA2_/MRDRNA2_78414_c0_seq1.p1  ORF type:complete len:120 (+),score=1.51 gnl/MRDRNA2_/MRDRNA2_78414_c0_seq1:10-369(+)